MKQIIQNFKTGQLRLEEVPPPALGKGFVLVKNMFSLISSGTERATVILGSSSIIGKAKSKPELVRQVLQNVKKEGVFQTLRKVNNKLDTPKMLGYSSCGIVLNSKDFIGKFQCGDRVACAGQDYASHAEVVCVPQNLVVKIPENVSFQEAAFTTLGAIALQGVRQADVRIGENICVIGLGLIGQITHQILTANGCKVFGIDIDEFAIQKAEEIGINEAMKRDDPHLISCIERFTSGYGFDKVLITASSKDNDPIVLATQILRKKGQIVVVGNVKMDIPREPHFYRKELELKIATSYGPGRYDSLYEEKGIDYPYAYVRWTENRNMELFLDLISQRKVKVTTLITHIIDFDDALSAYDIILGKREEKFIGILLEYKDEESSLTRVFSSKVNIKDTRPKPINIGFIGAGNFAQNYLLPCLKKFPVSLETVVTTKGVNARNVAEKFGFNSASTSPEDVIEDNRINTVFIATRHNTHAEYVCRALKYKKNIFVEKPLALNLDELKEIISLYNGETLLMVGFNRRFAPISRLIKRKIKRLALPIIMNFRINAGYIPEDSWIQDPNVGGGRIIGEVCHFIDLMIYFVGALPKRVCAASVNIDSTKWSKDDNLVINLEFINGSVGSIVYTAMGSERMEKERLEIFAGGNSYVISDFKEGIFYQGRRVKKIRNKGKGHYQEIEAFISALENSSGSPIDFKSIIYTTLTTFKIIDSIKSGRWQEINDSEFDK